MSDIFSFRTAISPRILVMEGADNVRDLGGYLTTDGKYRVAQGKIFRGNRLDTLTPEGLRTALEVYKIRTDLDLRNEKDGAYYNGVRSPLGDSVNYINSIGMQYDTVMRVTERFLSQLLIFTDPENYPIYIHCSAGRDRTGTLFFVLGALLGIPEKDLLADYEMTYLTQYAYPPGDTTGHDRFVSFFGKIERLARRNPAGKNRRILQKHWFDRCQLADSAQYHAGRFINSQRRRYGRRYVFRLQKHG